MISFVLCAVVLHAEPDGGDEPGFVPPPIVLAADAGTVVDNGLDLHAAAEAEAIAFPSGTPGGSEDGFVSLRPILGLEIGEDFAVEVGADFRLRVVDAAPNQRSEDIGGVLRGRDWDEASDFGQIIRSLRVNRPENGFWIQAGPVRKKTLGLGHLVSRYSNQDNPDYHPAAASVGAAYRAISGQLFASDVFGARIFAGEAVADLGRIASDNPGVFDRFHLGASIAHDVGRAGGVTSPATLVELDFDAVVFRSEDVRVTTLVGFGTRIKALSDLGLVTGLAIDATPPGLFSVGGKLELRKQAGGYRQGYFGPGYELARFADLGFSGLGRSEVNLPDGFSLYAEVHLAFATHLGLDLALERFFWGRIDGDGLLSLSLIGDRLVAGARFTAVGLGLTATDSRYGLSLEVRLRIFSSFYLLGSAGTVFFPQADQSLVRGIYAGAGAGVDFER